MLQPTELLGRNVQDIVSIEIRPIGPGSYRPFGAKATDP